MSESKHSSQVIDRRKFLVGSASMFALAGTGMSGCSSSEDENKGESCGSAPAPLDPIQGAARVVDMNDAQSVLDGNYDASRIKSMLEEGLKLLTDVTNLKDAWKILLPDFNAKMRIGLKVNCLSSNLFNSREMLSSVIDTLVNDLGAARDNIWVWDRRTDELKRSKLDADALGVKVQGTVNATDDNSGPGYETQSACVLKKETRLSRILTTETDVTINLSLLKTHNVSGITGALKNCYGCIDNPGMFHEEFAAYLPALFRLDKIHKPIRLHIIEGLMAVTKGDTTDFPDAIPGRIILAQDPVAIDTYARDLVNSLRKKNPRLMPIDEKKLTWLKAAADLNLGTQTLDAKAVAMP